MSGPDWKLTKRNDACHACDAEFAENEPFFSLLAFETDEVRREDVCRACFPGREAAAGERLIYWRARHRVGKKAFAVDFEALEGLFLALEGREELPLRELRYLLSLLLMRKKRVKLLRTARRDDGEAMILRRPRRTEELCVYVFDLTPERAEVLRGKLRAIFEGADLDELAAPESPEAPQAEDADAADAAAAPDAAGPDSVDGAGPARAPVGEADAAPDPQGSEAAAEPASPLPPPTR